MQKEETNNSPHKCKHGWKHSTPRLPKAVDFPMCNNADIDWYMMMSTDPLPVDPEVEMQPVLHKEEGTTLEPTFPMIDSLHTD